MKWKVRIKNNLIKDEYNNVVYRLGEHHWGRHCIIYGDLIGLSYDAVATIFPIDTFKHVFAYEFFSGRDDGFESFPFLDRHSAIYARSKIEINSVNMEKRMKYISRFKKYLEDVGIMKMVLEEHKNRYDETKTVEDIVLEMKDEYDD